MVAPLTTPSDAIQLGVLTTPQAQNPKWPPPPPLLPDVLLPVSEAVPDPGENEVLVKVAAAGVNRPDVLQRQGLYPLPPDASPLPGLEISGEVVARIGIPVRAGIVDEHNTRRQQRKTKNDQLPGRGANP